MKVQNIARFCQVSSLGSLSQVTFDLARSFLFMFIPSHQNFYDEWSLAGGWFISYIKVACCLLG